MKFHIEVREDDSEIVRYNFDDYSAYVQNGKLSWFPNYAVNSHWHNDLEFIVVLSGYMLYNINGTIVRIDSGQGLIVNARRFHYGFSTERVECDFLCILLHPMLLCASPYLESNFVMPFLSDSTPSYFLLHENVSWENDIITAIKKIYACRHQAFGPLQIQSSFSQIWLSLYKNIFQHETPPQPNKLDQKLTLLKYMISFIKKNYQEKITLEDIAKAGYLSKNGCLSLFKRYLKETPISFLVNYRLKIGTELLCSTNSPVTEIAYMVGFSNASYFTESFRKFHGCTPLEYRKTHSTQKFH
jgi:AraC-type DNA-binding domain-containing proteins